MYVQVARSLRRIYRGGLWSRSSKEAWEGKGCRGGSRRFALECETIEAMLASYSCSFSAKLEIFTLNLNVPPEDLKRVNRPHRRCHRPRQRVASTGYDSRMLRRENLGDEMVSRTCSDIAQGGLVIISNVHIRSLTFAMNLWRLEVGARLRETRSRLVMKISSRVEPGTTRWLYGFLDLKGRFQLSEVRE
jgi:hypothetical protein